VKDLGFCEGKEVIKLWLFPVPVGPEVDSLTGDLHQFHFRFLPTDYGCLLQRRYQPNDGFAAGAISTAGGAISGSGLEANPDLSV